MDVAGVVAQLNTLLAEFEDMGRRAQYNDLSDLPDHETDAFNARAHAAILRLSPVGSAYRLEAETANRNIGVFRIPPLVGILRALRADVLAGWTATIEELVHADTFSDFIEMARELARKGYKDAAAVLGGSVLEAHLRHLCLKSGISTSTATGAPLKADTMNVELAKGGVYNTLRQKQVTAWLGLRNSAAHGKYSDYDVQQVTALVDGVEAFLLAYPA